MDILFLKETCIAAAVNLLKWTGFALVLLNVYAEVSLSVLHRV